MFEVIRHHVGDGLVSICKRLLDRGFQCRWPRGTWTGPLDLVYCVGTPGEWTRVQFFFGSQRGSVACIPRRLQPDTWGLWWHEFKLRWRCAAGWNYSRPIWPNPKVLLAGGSPLSNMWDMSFSDLLRFPGFWHAATSVCIEPIPYSDYEGVTACSQLTFSGKGKAK